MEQDFAKRRQRTPLAEPSPTPQPSSLGLLLIGLVTGIAVGLFVSLLIYLSGTLPPPPGQAPVADNRQIEAPAVTTAQNPGELTVEQQREAQRLQLEFYQELPNYEVVVDVTPISGATPRAPVTVTASTPDNATNNTNIETTTASATASTSVANPPVTPTEAFDPVAAALQEINNRTAANTSSSSATTPAITPAPTTAGAASFMLQAGAFQQQATANAQLNRLLGLGLNARVHQETLPGRTLFLVQAGPYASRDEMMQVERVLRSNSIDSMRITLSQP